MASLRGSLEVGIVTLRNRLYRFSCLNHFHLIKILCKITGSSGITLGGSLIVAIDLSNFQLQGKSAVQFSTYFIITYHHCEQVAKQIIDKSPSKTPSMRRKLLRTASSKERGRLVLPVNRICRSATFCRDAVDHRIEMSGQCDRPCCNCWNEGADGDSDQALDTEPKASEKVPGNWCILGG